MLKFLKSSGLYLLAGALILIFSFWKQGEQLSPKEFAQKIKETANAQVVDVRTPQEYSEGYIKNAINIDWNNDAFEKRINNLDKDKPVFVYCHSGNRSRNAARKMSSMGFTKIFELDGGIKNWRTENMPLAGEGEQQRGMNMTDYLTSLEDSRPVLVDFYARWCSPCKKMAPYLEELTKSHAATLKIVRINSDGNIALSDELKINGLPTLFLYRNGKKVWEHEGYISKEDLLKEIAKH